MNNRSDLVVFYFNLGLSLNEIRQFLSLKHNINISKSTLNRILRKEILWRKKNYSNLLTVYGFIDNELRGSSRLHGYKWMHLKCLHDGLVVTQDTIRLLLKICDPTGVEIRSKRKLRRRQYHNKGPNYLWHMDGYDKLKPFGIAISGCIDGFSRYIIWLQASYSNNDPRIISGYYIKATESCGGCPRSVRVDMGTENSHVEVIQSSFRGDMNDEGLPPFIYGTSQHNQRIEAWWPILRYHNAQFWINLFEELKDNDQFNGSFLDKSLIQFCFISLIQDELDKISFEWNTHYIASYKNQRAPSGRPVTLYNLPELHGVENYLIQVADDEIQSAKDLCRFTDDIMCDPDVQQLCQILMQENNFNRPNDCYEAITLYVNLRNQLNTLL